MKSVNAQQILLRNARVVTPERVLDQASVAIVEGRVSSISAAINEAEFETVIDLGGALLLPGFIDVHIHGAVGVDTMSAGQGRLKSRGALSRRTRCHRLVTDARPRCSERVRESR